MALHFKEIQPLLLSKLKYVLLNMVIEKCKTHAQVFSQTLVHGNSKYENTLRTNRKRKAEKREHGKKKSW